MMFGFNTAVSGLLASKRALYTTNHNIDNTNTKGYSRQQVSQRATSAYKMPGVGFLGTGTEIYNVERVRDSFVDFKYWNESAPTGEWKVKKANLTEIEKLMGEPSNNSFRRYIDDFYTSLDDMSKNPSDPSFREPVRENAMSFTKHINETSKRLQDMKIDTEYNIGIKVDHVNSLSTQIAALNGQIYSAEIDGTHANDLRDKRELLVDELSQIVSVKVNESAEGKYNVSVGGITMVNHMDTNKMTFNKDAKDVDKMLTWENSGSVRLKSGELKGKLDILTGDGKGNTYRGIPYFENQLDEFAKGYADKFNDLHKKGHTLNDKNGNSNLGGNFFYYDPNNPAATFTLDQDILDDIGNIAAGGKSGDAGDNTNLLALITQREDKTFFEGGVSQGTPDDFITSMISTMAVDSSQAKKAYETQEIMQKNIEAKRNSISGVSPEEEAADMVRFQHIYVASAKMLTTMDALLDLTVNRLGLVGR